MEDVHFLPYQYEPESDPENESEQRRNKLDEGAGANRRSGGEKSKTRVNLGSAFSRWRRLRRSKAVKSDAGLAHWLLDRYHQTKSSEIQPEQPVQERMASAETGDGVHHEYPVLRQSSESGNETVTAPPTPSCETQKKSGQKDGACETLQEQEKSKHMENEENKDIGVHKDEDRRTLTVGDGHYLLDLGSSSNIIIDEECILQLFRLCPECNRQCRVRKHVNGLKLVVYQACCFCNCRNKWTNLPDADEDKDKRFQLNGNYTYGFP